jgi:prepilin-type N-terminal cleavage/methylation domain-containing protein
MKRMPITDRRAFSLIELIAVIAIISLLVTLVFGAVRKVHYTASLAVSSANMRQLMLASVAYMGDHKQTFWKYRENVEGGDVRWWFGYETLESVRSREGERTFDPAGGPLGDYIAASLVPDPSFSNTGKAFKPKYKFGYLGAGYNVLLAHTNSFMAWIGGAEDEHLTKLHHLSKPSETVVFATSAQVNNFQSPASPSHPMIEEFYGIDERQPTVHFRHDGQAMVALANGSVGHLPMDPSTLDTRAPDAMIGRFAPVGDARYLR